MAIINPTRLTPWLGRIRADNRFEEGSGARVTLRTDVAIIKPD